MSDTDDDMTGSGTGIPAGLRRRRYSSGSSTREEMSRVEAAEALDYYKHIVEETIIKYQVFKGIKL